jgi:hypothetical protein
MNFWLKDRNPLLGILIIAFFLAGLWWLAYQK